MRKDLLDKIEEAYEEQKFDKSKEVNLSLTWRDMRYLRLWIRTAYANEEFLDEDLELK